MRVDVLDLGSHTFHLLSADVDERGRLETLATHKETVRIGERAFAEGRIPPEPFRRGVGAVGRLLAMLRGRGAEDLAVAATGVFREVANANAFVDELKHRYRLRAEILSGTDEARLVWDGVRSELADPDARLAIFDLGGGSLECALGQGDHVEIARSLPLGALRLKTRYLSGELSDPAALATLRDVVRDGAEPVVRAIRRGEPDEIAFSSGSARTLLKLARKLDFPEDVPGCIGRQTLYQLAMILSSLDEKGVADLGVAVGRADTIGTAAVVLSTIAEMLNAPFVRIASRALREGLALRCANRREKDRVWASG